MSRISFSIAVVEMIMFFFSGIVQQYQEITSEKTIENRIASRSFPSVFQAWNRADNLEGEDELTTLARHDLVWHAPTYFGLVWDKNPPGLAEGFTSESIDKALKMRRTLLKLNPNIILIAEIRYRDAHISFLPKDHKWWARDKDGSLADGWAEGGYFLLDFPNPEFQEQVAKRARAAIESGVFDGVMLDWWTDDQNRLALVKTIRKAIGDKFLIIVNPNDQKTPNTASYINGYFMECYRSQTPEDWTTIAETLKWAEDNLKEPRVNCLETWYHKSRMDLNLMRAVTTLSLTHSNGYCLFSDPNPLPTPDHLHNWYPFWNKSLSKPISKGVYREDGSVVREFENGTVVYNPMGNQTVTVVFPDVRTSLATGKSSKEHKVGSPDGDIFIKSKSKSTPHSD